MSWNNTNRAAKTTWTTLMLLDQLQEVFDEAGALKMEELFFWKATQSESVRLHEAEGLAIQIDDVFRRIRGAEFEAGVTRLQAIEDMVKVLNAADKTVSDLAKIADEAYHFWRERDKG